MVLIGLVRRALNQQVLLQATLCLEQPLRARPWNRVGPQAAMLIELMAGLAQPPIPALSASDDRLRIKLELHGG